MKREFTAAMLVMAAGGVLLLICGASALGYVALAAIAAVVATRSWARVVLAALVSIAFVAAAVVGAIDGAWLSVAGAAVVVVGSAWTAVRSRRWPALGSRYDRTSGDDSNFWDAQDRGHDPTDDLVE